ARKVTLIGESKMDGQLAEFRFPRTLQNFFRASNSQPVHIITDGDSVEATKNSGKMNRMHSHFFCNLNNPDRIRVLIANQLHRATQQGRSKTYFLSFHCATEHFKQQSLRQKRGWRTIDHFAMDLLGKP